MARTIGIGHQDFETVRVSDNFYIDKTAFIKEWWEYGDAVTLITRPRRFGKTLNMSMLEKFFSVGYQGRGDLFEHLDIWQEESFRQLQGTYPVLFLSFASIKEGTFPQARESICRVIQEAYNKHTYLLAGDLLTESEKEDYRTVSVRMSDSQLSCSLQRMCDYLHRYYGKKVIVLLDEYDTPIQEAYVNGFWQELTASLRALLNATFKTNSYLERGLMTGITWVSKESIFSDLNNLEVVTTTSAKYADKFGFTEGEVMDALEEYGLRQREAEVRRWYDGFSFGGTTGIYNPWSIINFLDKREVAPYWANTSSNRLAGDVIRKGDTQIKEAFEVLLRGETIETELDEQIVYTQLELDENTVWSLLLASGYLTIAEKKVSGLAYGSWKQIYTLRLTNFEVRVMFENMVRGWFQTAGGAYNAFIQAFLREDIETMNAYMNRITARIFSYFDAGGGHEGLDQSERFYHGFVLGLMVELMDLYEIRSNRESGFGRYDVILRPRDMRNKAMILEFKVFDRKREETLEDTVHRALLQIEEKQYAAELLEAGIPEEHIVKYGIGFHGRQVLIGSLAERWNEK